MLDGTFKKTGTETISRKIALYTQDKDKNVTERFTLKAPKLTVKSPNARIQGGNFVGDVYATADNFEIVDAKVEGNVYFINADAMTTSPAANIATGSYITGAKELAVTDSTNTLDAVSGASLVTTADALADSIKAGGNWFTNVQNDITAPDREFVMDGAVLKGGTAPTVHRTLNLYIRNEARVETASFTLTAKKLTVSSPNTMFRAGTFKGHLVVSGLNFKLTDFDVVGNVTFTSQAAKDTFTMDAKSSISGTQFVKTN